MKKKWTRYITLEWFVAITLVVIVLGLAVSDNAKGQGWTPFTTQPQKKCYPEVKFSAVMLKKYGEVPVLTALYKNETYILYVNMERRNYSLAKRVITGHKIEVCFLGGGAHLKKYNGPIQPT